MARTLTIRRHTGLNSIVLPLTVYLDGQKQSSVRNGGSLSLPLDEKAHKLRVEMGLNRPADVTVPAGTSDAVCMVTLRMGAVSNQLILTLAEP